MHIIFVCGRVEIFLARSYMHVVLFHAVGLIFVAQRVVFASFFGKVGAYPASCFHIPRILFHLLSCTTVVCYLGFFFLFCVCVCVWLLGLRNHHGHHLSGGHPSHLPGRAIPGEGADQPRPCPPGGFDKEEGIRRHHQEDQVSEAGLLAVCTFSPSTLGWMSALSLSGCLTLMWCRGIGLKRAKHSRGKCLRQMSYRSVE